MPLPPPPPPPAPGPYKVVYRADSHTTEVAGRIFRGDEPDTARLLCDAMNSAYAAGRRDADKGLVEAFENIVACLGPEPGCSECCEGCREEMAEALRTARVAIALAGGAS